MKAVMYGAGNIGRGFIGLLFSQSGYEVTFIDVAETVVENLNQAHRYPVRYVSAKGIEDVFVEPVWAVNGNDAKKTADVIAQADIMATAVGVRVLKLIAPNLAKGIRKRMQTGGKTLNIIICENLIDANELVRTLVKEQLTGEEFEWFEKNIGLVEASIGRMVPIQTEKMKDGNPLRVCVEPYSFLPVDKSAFKGEIPKIRNMVPYEPFGYYIKRKLYIHNMGHAICAYLGDYLGKEYIYQAINDSNVQYIVENAMLESARAISRQYKVSLEDILLHTKDLLERFTNKALGDTCARVGGDPARKLMNRDRLIGSSCFCIDQGIFPAYILLGTAGAVYRYLNETRGEQSKIQALKVLKEISNLGEGEEITEGILDFYGMFLCGASVGAMKHKAQHMEAERLKNII
ncbi:MAG: mannitol dehydrogenase [Lachnospiraceae bacterium]|nr:mannitol dehydrogenase [Lachnospiraceae bacterium]